MPDPAHCVNEESEFRLDELFFSRTDKRGVILAGNTVFQRVSKYGWDELIKAPHKLVRHPDMPKAIFWIMWDMIKRGEPVGAYVKNRAVDGSYYWVFAVVTPVEDGYLSVRLKPSSDLFDAIPELYAQLRAVELSDDLPAERSADRLVEALTERGYRDYASFMSRALVSETEARDVALSGKAGREIAGAQEIQAQAADAFEVAQSLIQSLAQVRGFPVNMRIQAYKLRAGGSVFAVVADSYARLCTRIAKGLEEFVSVSQEAAAAIDTGLFKLLSVRYQNEMAAAFKEEIRDKPSSDSPIDRERESTRLTEQSATYAREVDESLKRASEEWSRFGSFAAEMNDRVNALNVTQVTGLIETARLGSEAQTLSAMLQEMTEVQNAASESVKRLIGLTSSISQRTVEIGAGLRASCAKSDRQPREDGRIAKAA